jgi:hypothetical protein
MTSITACSCAKAPSSSVISGKHISLLPPGVLLTRLISRAILHNPAHYPDPDAFNPDRFMPESTSTLDDVTKRKMDPRNYVFGFGRRGCPGQNLVDGSAWFLMATMVATLDMNKAKDAQGNVIEPVVDFNNSVFRTPDIFECDIRPRSDKALHLLARAETEMA